MTPITRAHDKLPSMLAGRVTPRLLSILHEVGALAAHQGASAYAVGGCVRDWWLGRPVHELDIMVEGNSLNVARAFAAAHQGATTEHPQFRTATVEYRAGRRQQRVDFAACRKERYAEPAAYPTVSPGTLQDDLFRRDFTVNAMAMSLDPADFGQLIDRYHGAEDLNARLIRVLHARSFEDDPSRILRAIRFAERLRFTIEPQTAAWLRAALREQRLSRLNRGRLRKELLAMLEEPDPFGCLRALGRWLLASHNA